MWTEPLEFGKLTWPEVARAAGEGRVPIVPIGTLEDHGYHLPIDTDVTLVEAVCRGAAERLPAQTVLLPPIVHGYSPHHMDFPGTISIRWDTFCRYCTDVALSLVRHGFQRVLMVNGHGSNQNLVETAARLAMVEEPESLVAASFYLVSERSARGDRGGPRLGPGRYGPRLRAGDLAVPAPASGGRGHVQGGRRAWLRRDRARLDGLVGRAVEDHAVVVVVLRIRRPGRRQQGDRRQGREPCSRPQRRRSPPT